MYYDCIVIKANIGKPLMMLISVLTYYEISFDHMASLFCLFVVFYSHIKYGTLKQK